MSYKVAIAGIEYITGQEILSILDDRDFPISDIVVACEDKNQAKPISFGEKTINMIHIDLINPKNFDLIFLTGSQHAAKQITNKLCDKTIVIDLTSSTGKVLSIPSLGHMPSKNSKLIASPSSSSIQLYESILPLASLGKIEDVIVSTYQSVSNIGRPAMDELFNQMRNIYMNNEPKTQYFKKQISFNVIPQIGDFEDNHSTTEEDTIIKEVSSLFDNPPQIAITCVNVPTFVGNAQSITIKFDKDIDIKDIKTAWRETDNIEIIDLESEMEYVTPSEIQGEQNLFISRIRKNENMANSISFWSVTDNLKNGEALNAVKIAESVLDIETSHLTSNIV